MKGLLYKDFLMVWKYCKVYLLIIVGFLMGSMGIGQNTFYIVYPSIMSSMIPMTLVAYDEQSKWNLTSLAMPCSRAQLVSVKYLMGLLTGLGVVLATAVIQAIRLNLEGSFLLDTWLGIVCLVFVVSCVTPALSLPLIFKLGAEKGRIYHTVVTALICCGAVLLSFGFPEMFQRAAASGGSLVPMSLATIAIYAFSWWLSIRFYEKREF